MVSTPLEFQVTPASRHWLASVAQLHSVEDWEVQVLLAPLAWRDDPHFKCSISNCLLRGEVLCLSTKFCQITFAFSLMARLGLGAEQQDRTPRLNISSFLHLTLHTSCSRNQVMKQGLKQQLILKIKSIVMEGESISFHLPLSPSPSLFSLSRVDFASLTPFLHYSSLVMRGNAFTWSGFSEKGISQGLLNGAGIAKIFLLLLFSALATFPI